MKFQFLGWPLVAIALLAISCERWEPLSMIDACVSHDLAADGNVDRVTCEVDNPIALLLVPRSPVTEQTLRAADSPEDAVKALADRRFDAPMLCRVPTPGRAVQPSAAHPDVSYSVHSECVESRFEVSHPLVVRGRSFTFLLGRSAGKSLLVGVKTEK